MFESAKRYDTYYRRRAWVDPDADAHARVRIGDRHGEGAVAVSEVIGFDHHGRLVLRTLRASVTVCDEVGRVLGAFVLVARGRFYYYHAHKGSGWSFTVRDGVVRQLPDRCVLGTLRREFEQAVQASARRAARMEASYGA